MHHVGDFPAAVDAVVFVVYALHVVLDLLVTADVAAAKGLTDATTLSPYGVEVRYPGELQEPDRSEARAALVLAEMVRDTVVGALPSEVLLRLSGR